MPIPYDWMITIITVLLAAIASSRFGYVFGYRWGMRNDGLGGFAFACAAAAGIVMYFVSSAALEAGGITFGLIGIVATIPFVGFMWMLIAGGNKALERILNGLLKKLS